MAVRHGQLLRCIVDDLDGRPVGRVVDTAPLDGGSPPEMALVRLGGGLGRRRWVPLAGADWSPGRLKLPVPRHAVEDAPPAEEGHWGDPLDVARAYWTLVVD